MPIEDIKPFVQLLKCDWYETEFIVKDGNTYSGSGIKCGDVRVTVHHYTIPQIGEIIRDTIHLLDRTIPDRELNNVKVYASSELINKLKTIFITNPNDNALHMFSSCGIHIEKLPAEFILRDSY